MEAELLSGVSHLLRADGTQVPVAEALAGKKWCMLYWGCAWRSKRASPPMRL